MALMSLHDVRIGIVGLGYVGLPLAVYMARHFPFLASISMPGALRSSAPARIVPAR